MTSARSRRVSLPPCGRLFQQGEKQGLVKWTLSVCAKH
ncbi:hypothetical protein chiPu_0033328, partial [Chiloscyllium punctatum]|nr:hypothetical protein [Chiloscyllium punctatum]